MQVAARERAHAPDLLGPLLVARHDATEHVAMPANRLGARMDDHGCAAPRGLAEHGRREGGVDEDGHAARLLAHRRDVDEHARRVDGRLAHDQDGVGAHVLADRLGRRPGHLDVEQAGGEQRIGAAVERADADHVPLAPVGRARSEQDRGDCRHAGGERDGLGEKLKRGDRLLEPINVRVVHSLVDRVAYGVAARAKRRHALGRGLQIGDRVRCRQVDRRNMRRRAEAAAAGVHVRRITRAARAGAHGGATPREYQEAKHQHPARHGIGRGRRRGSTPRPRSGKSVRLFPRFRSFFAETGDGGDRDSRLAFGLASRPRRRQQVCGRGSDSAGLSPQAGR
mmetsp:Transcript_15005/g.46839  ORF Transcript_15005/g.46839 Transcript_15005/m.46839 type:complete len:339 (+) Transcript_15005:968-1984(+)